MTYKVFRHVLLGFGLLVSTSAAAQEFDSELQLSTSDDIVYWYRICTGAIGMDGFAMTDLNQPAGSEQPDEESLTEVFMLPTETEDIRSQWKLTAGKDGKVIIPNRATGYQISNKSTFTIDHNITRLTASGAPGFVVTPLGDFAFRLEGVEDDGVNRCLALADKETGTIFYPGSDESASAIAWKFFPVEIDTGAGSMKAGRPVVRVAGKHITVSGCSDWQLFNALGEAMPRTVSLPTGVYMVKLPQGTVKVAVP